MGWLNYLDVGPYWSNPILLKLISYNNIFFLPLGINVTEIKNNKPNKCI